MVLTGPRARRADQPARHPPTYLILATSHPPCIVVIYAATLRPRSIPDAHSPFFTTAFRQPCSTDRPFSSRKLGTVWQQAWAGELVGSTTSESILIAGRDRKPPRTAVGCCCCPGPEAFSPWTRVRGNAELQLHRHKS